MLKKEKLYYETIKNFVETMEKVYGKKIYPTTNQVSFIMSDETDQKNYKYHRALAYFYISQLKEKNLISTRTGNPGKILFLN